jgi:membrane protease subunit (stomatin/prohibitin family)
MSSTLTPEEKIIILDQHIRSLDFSIYGLEVEAIQINSVESIDQESLDLINEKLESLNIKKTALNQERASLMNTENVVE